MKNNRLILKEEFDKAISIIKPILEKNCSRDITSKDDEYDKYVINNKNINSIIIAYLNINNVKMESNFGQETFIAIVDGFTKLANIEFNKKSINNDLDLFSICYNGEFIIYLKFKGYDIYGNKE